MAITFPTGSLKIPSGITALPSGVKRPAFGTLYGYDAQQGGGDASPVTRQDDLASWWKLNESSGTTAEDTIDGKDMTLTNMDGSSDWVDGKADAFGNCLEFDGTNDHVILSDFVSPATTVSWCCWSQVAENKDQYFIGQDDSFIFQYYRVGASATYHRMVVRQWFNDGSYNQHYYSATGERVYHAFASDAQPWLFTCSTWDGSDHVSYIKWHDGTTEQAHTKTSSLSKTLDAVTGDIMIGGTGSWGTGTGGAAKYINGKVDDVRVYDVALSSSDVDDIYNSGAGDFG